MQQGSVNFQYDDVSAAIFPLCVAWSPKWVQIKAHMGLNCTKIIISFFVSPVHPLHNGHLSASASTPRGQAALRSPPQGGGRLFQDCKGKTNVLERAATTGKYSLLVLLIVMLYSHVCLTGAYIPVHI